MDTELSFDNNHPLIISDGIYWVGYFDDYYDLHCNPFIITDGTESVIIDSGSRPDFSRMVVKILELGINPADIVRLVYSHYDPDVCGNVPNLEALAAQCAEESGKKVNLRIITHSSNVPFLFHVGARSEFEILNNIQNKFVFSSGRTLRFFHVPFCHAAGSFFTYDEKTGVLFTSDLFGKYSVRSDFYLTLPPKCLQICGMDCSMHNQKKNCPLDDMFKFHRETFPSAAAIQSAIATVKSLDVRIIAPQHGSVITCKDTINAVCRGLAGLSGIGIEKHLPRA